uniref:Uncharacterized protein n=1 Tax=Parascaris univalens TaxID=6257 RepID=A0A914ZU41_PARUN
MVTVFPSKPQKRHHIPNRIQTHRKRFIAVEKKFVNYEREEAKMEHK